MKTDMNAVLNKKFGTSSDYPPADWSPTVNLMGPLPEKTIVSSPIADFSDGADDVPTKSLVVTIPPTLSGVSVLNEKQTGKTVFYPMDIEQGTISGTGYNTNSTTRIRTAVRKAVSPSTEYKIKVNSEVQIYEVHEYTDLTGASTHLTVNASEYTFTTKSTTNYLRILFRYSNNATITPSAITELQVTDENFFWKTYTASLGRTIYGGTADIVNGEGTENISAPTALNSLTWSKTTVGGHDAFYSNLPNGYIGQGGGMMDADCDTYDITTDSNLGTDRTIRFYYNANFNITRCVIRDDQYASYTGAQFKEAVTGDIVYQLADSARTDFTFTGQEIDTMLGYNAFWSEQGDTEVTYRADINLALGGQ